VYTQYDSFMFQDGVVAEETDKCQGH